MCAVDKIKEEKGRKKRKVHNTMFPVQCSFSLLLKNQWKVSKNFNYLNLRFVHTFQNSFFLSKLLFLSIFIHHILQSPSIIESTPNSKENTKIFTAIHSFLFSSSKLLWKMHLPILYSTNNIKISVSYS